MRVAYEEQLVHQPSTLVAERRPAPRDPVEGTGQFEGFRAGMGVLEFRDEDVPSAGGVVDAVEEEDREG